jgi:hypothetical protein
MSRVEHTDADQRARRHRGLSNVSAAAGGGIAAHAFLWTRREGIRDLGNARAKAAGVEVLGEPHDAMEGTMRGYSARDLEGNLWSFGTDRPGSTERARRLTRRR